MTPFRNQLLVSSSIILLSACQSTQTGTLYHSFTNIDPVTESVTEDAWLVVESNIIKSIGSSTPPLEKYKTSKDMSGLFALPGLIDAHAHITAGPHKVEITDTGPLITMESQDEVTRFNARTALGFGITTIRNPGGDTNANFEYDKNIADGTWIGPDAIHAGTILQPLPMGGSAFTHPKNQEEWDAEAKLQAEKGMRYFKLYVGLNKDELEKGINAAHRTGLKATAHLDSVSWITASELGIDGLEHALPTSPDLLEAEARKVFAETMRADSTYMYRWFELVDFEGQQFQSLIDSLVENQVELNFNFLVNYLIYNGDNPDLISSDWDRFSHPETLEALESFRAMSLTGWTEEDFDRARKVFPKVLEFGKILFDAGLPVMIGTDAAGGTPYYAMEMQFHLDAGIPIWDVLKMATSSTAEILEISDRVGRVEPGMEADIVFLKSDPLLDIKNVTDVEVTLSNGKPYYFYDLVETE